MKRVKFTDKLWGFDKGDERSFKDDLADFAVKRGRAEYMEEIPSKKADPKPRGRKKKVDIEAEKLLNKSL